MSQIEVNREALDGMTETYIKEQMPAILDSRVGDLCHMGEPIEGLYRELMGVTKAFMLKEFTSAGGFRVSRVKDYIATLGYFCAECMAKHGASLAAAEYVTKRGAKIKL